MKADKRITLRVTNDLHAELVKMAKDERRSLNSQIINLIEDNIRARRTFGLGKESNR